MRVLKWMWRQGILNNVLAGLFVVLPIAVTIAIMGWIVAQLRVFVGPDSLIGGKMVWLFRAVLEWVGHPVGGKASNDVTDYVDVAAVLVGWTLVLAAIWGLGLYIKLFAKSRLETAFRGILNSIPLFSTIYRPISQVFGLLKREGRDMKGMTVVICSFGTDHGGRFLALLTSGVTYRFGVGEYKLLFIPASPVPLSGGLIFAPTSSIEPIEMRADDLMKICFSLGVLTPQTMPHGYKAGVAENPS
jgi:uncharacterized membrane protein